MYRDGAKLNFPKEHEDYVHQTVDYPIDLDGSAITGATTNKIQEEIEGALEGDE